MRALRSHTGYGVFDLTRHVARRVREEWEAVEMPAQPPAVTVADRVSRDTFVRFRSPALTAAARSSCLVATR